MMKEKTDSMEKIRIRAAGDREEDVESFFGINKDGNAQK